MNLAEKTGSFVPAPLLAWIADGVTERRFPAVVAFADVSGFTAMSEKLASIGREGAETLTGILNSYFSAMISRIHARGGFVGKFGGDAMTIFFPQNDGEALGETVRRAVAASCGLQTAMDPFLSIQTKAGTFSLGMKVGIGVGDVLFKLVSDAEGTRDYLLAGKPLDAAAEAEHHGSSGEVILGPSAAAICKTCGAPRDEIFIVLAHPNETPDLAENIASSEITSECHAIARQFIDPAVYHRMLLGLDSVGEIRKVSILFLAFSGLDYDNDSEVGDKLEELYRWVQSVVKRYGGSINKVDMGDKGSKILITFGAPTAHENDELLAIHCGLELVEGQAILNGWGVKSRAGIATGIVFAGEVGAETRQEYTVMGRAVNLAARLMGRAGSGMLLADEATYKRCATLFEFSPPDMAMLKGIAQPIPIYQVIANADSHNSDNRTDSLKLVGRSVEQELLFNVIQQVREQGRRTVVIRGEAGTGKTSLAQYFTSLLQQSGYAVGVGEALSYAKNSPYLSIISALKGLMDLPPGSGEAAAKRLRDIITEADPEHDFRLPIIGSLLGIQIEENDVSRHFDASLRQENLFDFLLQYFRGLTNSTPAAVLIEDAQWIDKNTLELLAYLNRNLNDQPFLLILVRRQYSRQFVSPYISEIEGALSTVVINVPEFTKEETGEFILRELEADSLGHDLLDFVFSKSQGNAAFSEELLHNLKALDKIVLTPTPDGIVATGAGDLSQVDVPDSLNSLIMSQLDRMGEDAKLTLKVAAVIGRRFAQELLAASYPVEIEESRILQNLKELNQSEFILPDDDQGLLSYIFKNLLTRDVAYDSLLFAHRREYHRRVGISLESLHSDALKEHCEELARHFYQTDDDQRAARYYGMAGDKAFDLYANESADDYYSKALERVLTDIDPKTRYHLLTMRAKVYTMMGKTDAWKKDLDEALELAEKQIDLKGKVDTLNTLAQYWLRINKLDEMERVVQEAHRLLSEIDHPFGRITILSKMGALAFTRNDYKTALTHWQEGSYSAEKIGDKSGLSMALTNCGLAHKALGNLDAALDHYQRSIEIDQQMGNLKSEAVNLGNLGVLYHQRGDFEEALEAYHKALEISRKIGSKEIQARNIGNLAVLYQLKGERAKALTSQQEKLAIEMMMGYRRGQAGTLSNIGMWYAEEGELNRAISFYNEALEITRELSLKGEEPRLIINLGLAYHHLGDLDTAINMLSNAVELSDTIGQKVYAQYARRYLGFALMDSGKYPEALSEFRISGQMAAGMGGKVGVAASCVGEGLVELLQGQGSEKLLGGLAEVRRLGDIETLIKAEITYAKWLITKGDANNEAKQHLTDALDIARSSGRKRDILNIEPLLERL